MQLQGCKIYAYFSLYIEEQDEILYFGFNVLTSSIGGRADLIIVFFDPIGQALCRRTLNVVGECYHHHY